MTELFPSSQTTEQVPQGVGVASPAPSPADSKHSPACARCGAPAVMWSGAWLVTESRLWIGWCSNLCKNAWLDGDKGPCTSQTAGQEDM